MTPLNSETLRDRYIGATTKQYWPFNRVFKPLCRSARSQKQTQLFFKVKMKFLSALSLITTFQRDRNSHLCIRVPENDKIITWTRKWPEQRTHKEGEMAALIESITAPNTKKSTAIVQHSLWVRSPSLYRRKYFWKFVSSLQWKKHYWISCTRWLHSAEIH